MANERLPFYKNLFDAWAIRGQEIEKKYSEKRIPNKTKKKVKLDLVVQVAHPVVEVTSINSDGEITAIGTESVK